MVGVIMGAMTAGIYMVGLFVVWLASKCVLLNICQCCSCCCCRCLVVVVLLLLVYTFTHA